MCAFVVEILERDCQGPYGERADSLDRPAVGLVVHHERFSRGCPNTRAAIVDNQGRAAARARARRSSVSTKPWSRRAMPKEEYGKLGGKD